MAEKDKVESRTFKFFTFSDEQKQQMRVAGLTENDIQNITQYRQGLLAQEARDKVMSDYMAEVASRPPVPQQGQGLRAIAQELLTAYEEDENPVGGETAMWERLKSALAASRSEEATAQKLLCPSCGSEFINCSSCGSESVRKADALATGRTGPKGAKE